MDAEARSARHESRPARRHPKAPTIRQRGRQALVGAGLLLVGGVADSFRGQAKDLVDSFFQPALQKSDLVWFPADCPGGDGTAAVGLGGCASNELRGLAWFSKQILAFKAARLRGFDSLPDDLSLVTQDYNHVKNNVLVIERPDGTELGKLGVGYSREKNAKDGCLRLYGSASPPMRVSPVLCLDTRGYWWSKDSDEDAAVRLKLREHD